MVKGGARVIGYCRCSTTEQAASGLSIEAQRSAIEEACARKGLNLVDVVIDDGVSGKTLDRPGLLRSLEQIAAGEADVLMAAKLDRVSRSVVNVDDLLEWFTEAQATLMALDLGIDTSTPNGRLVANVLSSVAQWERETIADRTRIGLAALRARGKPISRPAVADRPDVAKDIKRMRDEGMTLQAIADHLNASSVPTLRGAAAWRPSSVQAATGYKRRAKPRRRRELPAIPSRRSR